MLFFFSVYAYNESLTLVTRATSVNTTYINAESFRPIHSHTLCMVEMRNVTKVNDAHTHTLRICPSLSLSPIAYSISHTQNTETISSLSHFTLRMISLAKRT